MASPNTKRKISLQKEQELKSSHLNFMGAPSYELTPITRLKTVASSNTTS